MSEENTREENITEQTEEIMTVENIQNRVYFIRGQQVMLDTDLAIIYGYEVKKLNQQFVTRSEMRLVTAKVSEISLQVAGITDCPQNKYIIAVPPAKMQKKNYVL